MLRDHSLNVMNGEKHAMSFSHEAETIESFDKNQRAELMVVARNKTLCQHAYAYPQQSGNIM